MMNNTQHTTRQRDPQRLVSEFLNEFRSSGNYLRDNIAGLAAQAASEIAEVAEPATGAIFASLVERLADSFDPAAVTLYNRVFAQLIQSCRATEQGRMIDGELNRFGLRSEQDLLARAESLRRRPAPGFLRARQSSIKRIILLSRVTLGADVAITSVIIERMKREFPAAEITLAGGRKATELFGGDQRVSFKEIGYRRAGTTIERLLSWVDLLDLIRELTNGLAPDEFLIADPDTRLTQLGLLPVTGKTEQYLFFPSREYGGATSEPLAKLTSRWLSDLFGDEQEIHPRLSLARADVNRAKGVAVRLRQASERPVVTINFGVGENPAKRVSDEFERSLVSQLISDGATVILDRGAGEDEKQRSDAVIKHANEGCELAAVEFDEQNLARLLSHPSLDANLMVWSGRIGMFAALISESDLYIGYDSAGQHIAAALGVPSIDVFAGFASARMLDRWRPAGTAPSRVITVRDTREADALLSETLAAAWEMLNRK